MAKLSPKRRKQIEKLNRKILRLELRAGKLRNRLLVNPKEMLSHTDQISLARSLADLAATFSEHLEDDLLA